MRRCEPARTRPLTLTSFNPTRSWNCDRPQASNSLHIPVVHLPVPAKYGQLQVWWATEVCSKGGQQHLPLRARCHSAARWEIIQLGVMPKIGQLSRTQKRGQMRGFHCEHIRVSVDLAEVLTSVVVVTLISLRIRQVM